MKTRTVQWSSTCRNRREVRGIGRATPLHLLGMVCVALTIAWTDAAGALDTVTIASGAGGQAKLTGRVIDYTGSELRLELVSGREQSIAPEQVVGIDTQYSQSQLDANEAFDKQQFREALLLYDRARKAEAGSRNWVWRQITARIVWCYRGLDQTDRAGQEFLLLLRSDPRTVYFDCIPLAWIPRQPSLVVKQAARQWLTRPEPAAALLGASHLLAGSFRAAAMTKLRELAASPDRRVAQMAMAQSWRTALVTADRQQIDAWNTAIEQMPEALAAGPYFVLGRARAQQEQWQQAALAFLRIPILYPQERLLAAQSLLDAGRVLEKLDRSPQAARLYREVVRSYAKQARATAEAQSRIEALGGSGG